MYYTIHLILLHLHNKDTQRALKNFEMELLSDVPAVVATPEIRTACSDAIKFSVVERLVEEFKKEYKVIDVDGARILFDGGWGLVRASNTQPVLVLRFEARDEKRLNEIRKIVEDRLALIVKQVEA